MVNHTFSGFKFNDVGGAPGVGSGDGNSFTFNSAAMVDREFVINDVDGDAWFDDQDTDNGQTHDDHEILISIDGSTAGTGQDWDTHGKYDVTGSDGSTMNAVVFGLSPFGNLGNLDIAFTGQLNDGVTYTYSNYTHVGQTLWSEFATQGNANCFTTGMKILTERGEVAVEDLVPGDLVQTYDNGLQELRFIHHRQVRALGDFVPVLFRRGSIGNPEDLIVSQKHRMFTGTLPGSATRRFSRYSDHLIHAVALCNGTTVRLMPERKHVTYYHMMFDNHELVHCHGTVSESWQPTKGALKDAPEVKAELLSIFPEMEKRKSNAPGALARHEIQLRA